MSNKIKLILIVGFLVLAGCNGEYDITQHTIEVHFKNGDVDTIKTVWKPHYRQLRLENGELVYGNYGIASDVRYFTIIKSETKTKHE